MSGSYIFDDHLHDHPIVELSSPNGDHHEFVPEAVDYERNGNDNSVQHSFEDCNCADNSSSRIQVTLAGRTIPGKIKRISLQELLRSDSFQSLLLSPDDKIKRSSSKYLHDFIWVDFQGTEKEDMRHIQEKFGIHPLTAEDIMNTEDANEKIELLENYLFISLKEMFYEQGSNNLKVDNVNIIVSSKYVLTFHSGAPGSKSAELVWHRLKAGTKGPSQSDWVVHAFLDVITDILVLYVNGIVLEGEALDDLVLVFNADQQSDLLRRIALARRLLISLHTQVWAKKEILLHLTSKKITKANLISRGAKMYLRDVEDHLVQMEQKLHVTREMLNTLHSTYLARVSIEVSQASNAVNSVMKRFSAVATIFIPLTFITGLFGMNVRIPGQSDEVDNFNWFITLLVCFFSFGVAMGVIFKRTGWL